jgi:glucan 1,3-beta-glucosidase
MGLRGVNLGGWLVLERWITPSLFSGLKANDEYSFCQESLGSQKLQQHRDTFITKEDFEWLAQNGVDSVRIPVGYWALEDDNPFINCKEQLDKAFKYAAEFNLKIILDLHGAPGSQNGLKHSGRAGHVKWANKQNIERTLDVISQLSERYGKDSSLVGIELLNEPGWDIPLGLLREFYKDGYNRVREFCDENVAVIISDAFRPLKWKGFMNSQSYRNVILDAHLYQSFTAEDHALNIKGHIDKTYNEWGKILSKIDKPVIIGEWSLGLHPSTYDGMSEQQKNEAAKSYADAQLEIFGKTAGWFFWTYKTEDKSGWNFKYCTEKNLINTNF